MFIDFLLGWAFNNYIITDSGPIHESPFTSHSDLHLTIPNSLSALRFLVIVLYYHYCYYHRKNGIMFIILRHLREFHQWAQKLREKNGRAELYTMETQDLK